MPSHEANNEIPQHLERRSEDRLTSYRLTLMEQEQKRSVEAVAQIQTDITTLKEDISKEFASLRKTLFERPVFVTYEIMKIELESRDRILHELKKADGDQISTARHYTMIIVTLFIALVGPVIVNKLWGVP